MSRHETNKLLRQLPAVNTIVQSDKGKELVETYGHDLVVEGSGLVLGLWRKKLHNSSDPGSFPEPDSIIAEIKSHLMNITLPHFKKVINATGIILHTNLGRAVLSKKAQEAVIELSANYSNLEYNLQKGKRGSRLDHVEDLLIRLTGAESVIVVNNNAGAVLLAMHTLAAGKEVIVSRGELIEIGGAFRLPEVLKLGGVKLVEVGTTNRTHYADYKSVIGETTALILKVHTSNFRITGFTKSVDRSELAELAHSSGLLLVEDLGSGTLVDLSTYGLRDETPVPLVIAAGVDIVTFSGDKLLGGPQAGIIAGKKIYIDAMKKNQLSRALRVDKFTLAALEATLREYLRPETVFARIPTYRMLTASIEELQEKADKIMGRLSVNQEKTSIIGVPTQAEMGGGSLPEQGIPSWGLALTSKEKSPAEIERAFRSLSVPVIGFINKERFILDMRTILPGEEDIIIKSLQEICI